MTLVSLTYPMRRQKFNFGVRDLLLFSIFIPVAVGFVAACFGAATYFEVLVLDDPLRDARQHLARRAVDRQSVVGTVFGEGIYALFANMFSWSLTTLMIAVFAYDRWKAARIFTVALIVAFGIVEFLLAVPMSSGDGTVSLMFVYLVRAVLALIPPLGIIAAFLKLRENSIRVSSSESKHQIRWRWTIRAIVIAATLGVSALGWNGLRNSGVFG